jgi:3-deoxy-manno-octulosonate cytidylyltransferase (CMP-KDO synthetase)
LLATTQEIIPNKFYFMDSPTVPTIIVPARLASARFPRKLLADAGGKPLILRTAERLRGQVPELDLYFAVDGEELRDILEASGYKVILTNPDLPSGTDRIASANQVLKRELVINVQADEPMVMRDHILMLTKALTEPAVSISTLASIFQSEEDFQDPNQVKVVIDNNGNALYFSRAPIPFARDKETRWLQGNTNYAYKHMGLYGYKKEFLDDFLCSQEGELEQIEKLEQLRALQLGFRIAVGITEFPSVGVDVPADLKKISFS